MKTTQSILIIAVAILLGVLVFNSGKNAEVKDTTPTEQIGTTPTPIPNQPRENPNPGTKPPFPQSKVALSGETVCLPHKNTEGPQTLECAFGLKTNAGTYYALDLNALPDLAGDFQVNERVTVTGVITPVEALSSDRWQIYPIVGIFSVATIQKI